MARPCKVCTHEQREEIDTAMLKGDSYRILSKRFGVTDSSLLRHKQNHMPTRLAKAVAAQELIEVGHADDLYAQVQELRSKSLQLLRKAEASGDYRTALAGVREARACIELLMEVEGELDRGGDVHIHNSATLQTVIIAALKPFPDARIAVGEALAALEAS